MSKENSIRQLEQSKISHIQAKISKLFDSIFRPAKPPAVSELSIDTHRSFYDSLSADKQETYRQLVEVSKQGQSAEKKLLEMEWQESNFVLADVLQKLNGPVIEVGGPTKGGYRLLSPGELQDVAKSLFVSNLDKNEKKLDAVFDAQQMPFKDDEVGAIFASCLNFDVREGTTQEAYRVVEPGGLYIIQGGKGLDIQQAWDCGFKLVKYSKKYRKPSRLWQWDLVFQK